MPDLKVTPKIIIVRPRKKKSGGHHGGSWKVAYADFVTAMMAFFMVMWIVSMDEGVKDVVEGYFNNPIGFRRGYATGSSPVFNGSDATSRTQTPVATPQRAAEQERLVDAAQQIRQGVETLGLEGVEAEIQVSVTEEGLRVEMAEGEQGETFFSFGSAQPEAALDRVLQIVAASLADLSNSIIIEGHTDAAPYPRANYTNWELSVDRANTARRMLVQRGLDEARVLEVRGYADRRPRYADDPRNPGNRRVTLFVASSVTQPAAAVGGTNAAGGVEPGG